ncbi:MAG: hypothetical protein ABUL41_00650 [Chitinophagaceae bacterium]
MIEQTEMVVIEWQFFPSAQDVISENLTNHTTLQVMKKRAATKKGIACRLSCRFTNGNEPVLDYVAEHSYVIDLGDTIDMDELLKMIKNSFSDFNEKFEFRKLGTIVQNTGLTPLDETKLDLREVLLLLV